MAQQIAALFRRNGYVRRQNPVRLENEGRSDYKKGDEIRFTAESIAELVIVRESLSAAGFKLGKPYAQPPHQYRQPVYGKSQVARLFELIDSVP